MEDAAYANLHSREMLQVSDYRDYLHWFLEVLNNPLGHALAIYVMLG
jgi:hypothetical protein